MGTPSLSELATGMVTDFFDTLGIGSFATMTSVFRFTRMALGELIPGPLNVGRWVAELPRRKVQLGVGCALSAALVAMLMTQLALFPSGGFATGLSGGKLPFAVMVNHG